MFKLKLIYKNYNGESIDHESNYPTLDEATEEANDLAFSTTGFGIEAWEHVACFGEEGSLYYFYPNDSDRTTKYALKLFRTV